jgi:hypothetical protein
MNLTEEFTKLVKRLYDAKVDFAVCGGMAMALYGHPRFTFDIDLLIRAKDLPAALAVAKACGFDDKPELLKLGQRTGKPVEIQRLNKFQAEYFLTLDFVLVGPVLEDVWAGRCPFQSDDQTLFAVSRAGIGKMKLLAGRPQDLLDIQTLGFSSDDPAIQP